MKYQAVLFDLDGTLLPMHEPTFVACFYQALVEYVSPKGASPKQIGEVLKGSLEYVIKNDGICSNRQAFINFYDSYYNATGLRINIEDMEHFYATDFDSKVRSSCGYDPDAAQAVEFIKSTKTPIVVATNPFFPRVATCVRLGWAGLDASDFCEITTYENYHYCKPNIHYYQELFERTGFDPEKCLMVGNNVNEDMIANQLGCDVYLITRNLIKHEDQDISNYKQGDFLSLLSYLHTCK